LKYLKRNLGYKILSLALGILLYAVAFAQKTPHTSSDVYVQPEVINLPPEMAVKAGPTGSMVAVAGTQVAVQTFRAQSVKATVDLANARPGMNLVEIHYKTEGFGVEVSGPQRTQVTLEKRAKTTWVVDPIFDNRPPPGYTYVAVVEPRRVTVTGLASDVMRVDRVVAIVNNMNSGSAVSQTVDLVAQNVKNQVIDTVTIEPPRVKVTLDLKSTPVQKILLLSANISGTPAPGHAVVGYTFDPVSVTVAGPLAVLSERSSLSVPIDVSGLRETTTRTVTVPMPSGMSAADGKSVQTTVRLEVNTINIVASPTPQPSVRNPIPRQFTQPSGLRKGKFAE
jgi:YbbR domain-containing protein